MCMKKLLFAILSFSIVSFAMAQKASFGVKAGVNVANLNYKGETDPDSKIGVHAGALVHIHVSDMFAVQPEIMFSAQGARNRNNNDIRTHLNYINVPVLAQLMFGQGFRVQTGPQVGFLVSAKREENDVEIDIDDSYENVDFSWSLGAGYLFPGTGLGVDVRYNFGLSKVNDPVTTDAWNRVLQAGLFYQFNTGTKTKTTTTR
jgi:hypothetical protein